MGKEHFIAYYRVSTAGQGKSGLGLEAQRTAVTHFLKPGQIIIQEFIEVETGKKNNRGILHEALVYTKQEQGTLIIAKLDRLARNAAFIFTLRDSGVNFLCADMPEANTLTIGIFATLAQYERELISERTKKALAEKRKQGTILGTPRNLTSAAGLKGAAAMKEKAKLNENNRRASAMINILRTAGNSWSKVAGQLNSAGFTTSTGKRFQIIQVQRLAYITLN
jgi:DNA invertase Pin-like site-specific DNA recombinase